MTDDARAYVETRIGRTLTLAESNIDIAGLNADLEDGKQRLREAIEAEQAKQVRRWIGDNMKGFPPRVRVTPAMTDILADLYENGERHGNAELRKAGFTSYAEAPGREPRLEKLKAMLTQFLGGLNQRLARTTTTLDLSALSTRAIADAMAKVPGALDVAGRMISSATYAGLGAAFDRAAPEVDVTVAGTGGNGWEYTAVMDGGTCDPCSEADGTQYDTWDEAQADLPDGGPNPDCDGETRCRCRLAIVPL